MELHLHSPIHLNGEYMGSFSDCNNGTLIQMTDNRVEKNVKGVAVMYLFHIS